MKKLIYKPILLFLFALLMVVPCTVWGATIVRHVNTDDGTDDVSHGTGANVNAYATLSYCLSQNAQDLTDNGGDTFIVYCAGSADDTTAPTFSGWTLNATNRLKIIGEGIGASGLDTNKYMLNVADNSPIAINDGVWHIDFEDLQIQAVRSTNGSTAAISFASCVGDSSVTITRCIISGGANGHNTGCGILLVGCVNNAVMTYKISNNFIYGFDLLMDADNGCLRSNYALNVVYFYNNTCDGGYRVIANNNGTVHLKNNISINQFSVCYTGTFATSSHNLSEDDTSPDGATYRNKLPTFVNEGTHNYYLAAGDTIAKDQGEDVYADASYPITTDITNGTVTLRNDIGAHEYGSSSGGGSTPTYAYPQVILLQ